MMGSDYTPEQVDNAANVGEIIAVVKEEIGCLKVSLCPSSEMLLRPSSPASQIDITTAVPV